MKTSLRNAILILGLLTSMSMPFIANASQPSKAMSDAWITSKIKSDLTTNTITHSLNISVVTNKGNVVLSGTANSDTEAATAVEIAESTRSVNDVDTSNLNVQGSNQPLTDTYITAKVKGLFLKNYLMTNDINVPSSVKVETQKGVVYLSGKVKYRSQIKEAIKLAKSVSGVTNVIYTLKVS